MADNPAEVILPSGYMLRRGSSLDRALLIKFVNKTYFEISQAEDLSHLVNTVEQYFSKETPVWWCDVSDAPSRSNRQGNDRIQPTQVGCIWVGSAIDQLDGDRHAHIFLLYVDPLHRRKGIGSALLHQAENWALARGDRQIGLQVFRGNQPALNLYEALGYQVQSLSLVKSLNE